MDLKSPAKISIDLESIGSGCSEPLMRSLTRLHRGCVGTESFSNEAAFCHHHLRLGTSGGVHTCILKRTSLFRLSRGFTSCSYQSDVSIRQLSSSNHIRVRATSPFLNSPPYIMPSLHFHHSHLRKFSIHHRLCFRQHLLIRISIYLNHE